MKHAAGRSGLSGSQLRSKFRSLFHRAIVPHAHNDYRPHVSRLSGISLALIGVIALQFSYNFFETGSVLGRVTSIDENQLLAATNVERGKSGELPLLINAQLSGAAAAKLDDMFANQYWAHTSPSGSTPWEWVKASGYEYQIAGENLARDFTTSRGVVTAWMNSPEHRENILDGRYRDVGFATKTGTLNGNETTMVVALYGAPDNGRAVAGERTQAAEIEPGVVSPIAQLGVGISSLSPAAIGSIVVLLLVAVVALTAHAARNKLPYAWRQSWRRHHGLYGATVSLCFVVIIVALYGGGQI